MAERYANNRNMRRCGAYKECAYYAGALLEKGDKRIYVCGECLRLYLASGYEVITRYSWDQDTWVLADTIAKE